MEWKPMGSLLGSGQGGEIGVKRIGIIGTDNGHAHIYSALINGWREEEPLPLRNSDRAADPAVHIWGEFAQRLSLGEFGGHLPDVKVTRIWSADSREGQRLQRACQIEHLCTSPEQVSEQVDAVMVLSESPDLHFDHARAALERGLPTYIDKPLSRTSQEAEEIFRYARKHGAPCFSGSGARYSPELLAAREAQQRLIGDMRAMYIHCPISIPLYVSHALEMMNLFIGHDIEWAEAMEAKDRQIVLLQARGSISVVLDHVYIGAHPRYSGTLHGTNDYLPFTLTRLGPTMFAFIRAFARFVDDRVPPCPPEDTIALMRLSEAIVASLHSGERVSIRSSAANG